MSGKRLSNVQFILLNCYILFVQAVYRLILAQISKVKKEEIMTVEQRLTSTSPLGVYEDILIRRSGPAVNFFPCPPYLGIIKIKI